MNAAPIGGASVQSRISFIMEIVSPDVIKWLILIDYFNLEYLRTLKLSIWILLLQYQMA